MARHKNIMIANGYMGRDPEIKTTTSGKQVATFSIGCSFDDKTEWINCVAWEKTAEAVGKFTKKGSFIEIMGRMQTRKYTAKDGTEKSVTEVIVHDVQFLDSKQSGGKPSEAPRSGPVGADTDDDSSIPF